MHILLTNDDGVHAPGLAALERVLRNLGDVTVVAPLTEQSGVGHAITYLTPLMAREVFADNRRRGWAVEGSPADSVKLGVSALLRPRPDLVVSGINHGHNAGINVLYSGTVAAAIEGAFFGITSIAVSLEYDEKPHFDAAAELAVPLIAQILAQKDEDDRLFNINIPKRALAGPPEIRVAPMSILPWGEEFERRVDPAGRPYYWAAGRQPKAAPGAEPTDLSELRAGHVTVTPLHFDMTRHDRVAEMQRWTLGAEVANSSSHPLKR